jgi:hypothetical protein
MSLDPNWFYSSLAQSAAAIIGVVAAVALGRLQQQVSTLRALQGDADAAALDLWQELNKTEETLATFIAYAESTKTRLREDVGGSGVALPAERTLTFAVLQPERITSREEANKYANAIDSRLRLALDIKSRVTALIGAKTAKDIVAANAFLKFYGAQLFDEPADRHLLDRIILHANAVATYATRMESERSPTIAVLTVVILVWLAVFGVVCPLSYLSAYDIVEKHRALVFFAIGIASLPLLMIYEIAQLRRLGEYQINIRPATPAA